MLKDALDAYIQRDEALALDVIARDEEMDQMYNTLFREFLTFMLEDPAQHHAPACICISSPRTSNAWATT